jgi:hypothetical protein
VGTLRQALFAAGLTKPVVFAAENDCWPDAVQCLWVARAPFLNAGTFAGTGASLLAMLEGMKDRCDTKRGGACVVLCLLFFGK